jgi:hypothetical protein
MWTQRVSRIGAAGLIVGLVGCSSGDLTLPGQDQPGPVQPARLIVMSGDDQRAEAGALLEEPLLVRVLDDSARAVPNTPVRFRFLGDPSGAELAPASVLTDEQGRAATFARLGEPAGEQVIVAEVVNTELPDLSARFTATALDPDDHGDEKGGGKGHGSS